MTLTIAIMSKRQISLSTATTGSSIADGDRIIEIGCAEMIDGKLTDNSLHSYLNPERGNQEDARQAHGIPDEFLRDKPRFAEVAPELLRYLAGAEIIVHDADAHIAFLDQELERIGKPGLAAWVLGITDTLVMAEKLFPGKCNSLRVLCDRLEVETPSLPIFGALVNAELTGDVYLGLMHKLGEV